MSKAKKPQDWGDTLARFEASDEPRRVFNLSSPGVAQVTRVRLLRAYSTRVKMRTVGARLVWEKPGVRRPI